MTPLLLEVHCRCLLQERAQILHRAATLKDVAEETLDLWQRRGVTHLWLMGLWPTGPLARRIALEHPDLQRQYEATLPGWQPEDVAGSPYSIAAYEVPDSIGGMEALQALRQRLHARGIRLLLDFVPNHLGIDHPWVRAHPERFVQSQDPRPGTFPWAPQVGPFPSQVRPQRWLAHGRDPWFPPWTDTVQLDYRSADTRRSMIRTLERLASWCDGVRCDMAMLVLRDVFCQTWAGWPAPADPAAGEFWHEAIESVRRQFPEFVFLAEAYWGLEPQLLALGFDYVYDKPLYDALLHGHGPAVQHHLLSQPLPTLAAGVHFLENHDEARIASLLTVDRHRAAVWISWSLPGLRFLHEGQWEGARVRTPVQLRRRPAEPPNPDVIRLYEEIRQILPASGIGQGHACLLIPRAAWPDNPTGLNFVLVLWQAAPDRFTLVAVNYAPHPGQCRAPWPRETDRPRRWWVREHCGGWTDLRDARALEVEGIYLDLPAWGVQVLEFRKAD